MSRVYTDTLEPRKPTQDITLGTSGETISVGANSINVNTVKDKGGNTLWTSDGSGTLSSVNAGLKGNLLLLDTNTFTDAASSTFTTLIDSTYDAYIFKWNAINPATDDANFTFQSSTDGGSNYFYVAKNVPVPQGSTLVLDKPIDMAVGDLLQMSSSAVNTLHAVLGILVIS